MAKKIVPQAAAPADVMPDRGLIDALVMSAICAAIRLIEADEKDLAMDVLRLGRDRFEEVVNV